MADILIFDDSLEILEMLQFVLHHHGYTSKTTNKAMNFMYELGNNRPDLILLGVTLTDGNGREICRQLKADKQTKTIPIILMSANPDFLKQLEDCNADGKLEKPFEVKTLFSTIGQFLRMDTN